MGKSKKLPIIKGKTGRWYNRVFRRKNKQEVRDIKNLKDIEDYKISHPNEMVDKWDICDWIFYPHHLKLLKQYLKHSIEKYTRK